MSKMTYYHWLGAEAEQYHCDDYVAALFEAYGYDPREADGDVTIWPKL